MSKAYTSAIFITIDADSPQEAAKQFNDLALFLDADVADTFEDEDGCTYYEDGSSFETE